MSSYSRLSRMQEKENRWQIVAYCGLGVVLLFLVFKFGIPGIFSLASTINNMRHSGTNATTPAGPNLEIPSKPSISAQYTATSSSSVKITGVADPNINVTLFRGDQLLDNTVSDDQGQFNFDGQLSSGQNVFTVQATSNSGKKSETSDPVSVNSNNQPPKLEITSPADGATITNSDSVDIVGKTDPGADITVNDSNAIVNDSGEFRYFLRLNNGDNHVKVVSTDSAGNTTTKELTVKKPN